MSIDGTEFPAEEVSELESLHRIECGCGNILLVRERDLGRTLQCPACEELVYIAHELATPTGQQTHSRHYDDDEVPADLQPGDRFMATYEVRELIGRGGMAYVHRVHHKGWGIDLALKTPRPDLVWRNDWQRDFERECETWVGLTPHPNVVRCHYIRRLGGIPRLFLEFVSGGSVVHWTRHKLLYRGDPEEVLKRVLDVAMQIAWGLNHAHEQGLVHQDVKLGNVLMTRDGQAKVTDFGLMRAFGASNAVSTFYPTSGTPAYSAPEQGPETPPSHLADIWGWGASVLEMCVGTPRWVDHASLLKLFEAYRANRLERTRIANMPEPLAELLQECFRTKPEDRPGSMHRVMESLREVYQWTFGIPYDRKPPKAELASAEVLNNRAISLFELGKQQEAEILWQQAMALAPGQLETRFNNLLYEWRTGRCTDIVVIRSLMELMEKENRSPQSRYLLARVMLEWGDCRVAEDILHRIDLSPCNMREIELALASAKEASEDTRGLVRAFGRRPRAVKAVCLAPRGELALVGYHKGTLEAWNPFSGERVKKVLAHPDGVLALACSCDGRFLFSGGMDNEIRLWHLPAAGRSVGTHRAGSKSRTQSGRHAPGIRRSGQHSARLEPHNTRVPERAGGAYRRSQCRRHGCRGAVCPVGEPRRDRQNLASGRGPMCPHPRRPREPDSRRVPERRCPPGNHRQQRPPGHSLGYRHGRAPAHPRGACHGSLQCMPHPR